MAFLQSLSRNDHVVAVPLRFSTHLQGVRACRNSKKEKCDVVDFHGNSTAKDKCNTLFPVMCPLINSRFANWKSHFIIRIGMILIS